MVFAFAKPVFQQAIIFIVCCMASFVPYTRSSFDNVLCTRLGLVGLSLCGHIDISRTYVITDRVLNHDVCVTQRVPPVIFCIHSECKSCVHVTTHDAFRMQRVISFDICVYAFWMQQSTHTLCVQIIDAYTFVCAGSCIWGTPWSVDNVLFRIDGLGLLISQHSHNKYDWTCCFLSPARLSLLMCVHGNKKADQSA